MFYDRLLGTVLYTMKNEKNKKQEEIDFAEMFELLLYSLVPIVLIWITLMGFTFWFVNEISYTLVFWVYVPISSFFGLLLTSVIIEKARK